MMKLSKLIGWKWFLTLDELAKQSGLPKRTITLAVHDKPVGKNCEAKLREFLGKL